jgi:hypothetical protein
MTKKTTELDKARTQRQERMKIQEQKDRDRALAQALAENESLHRELDVFSSIPLPTIRRIGTSSPTEDGKRAVACALLSDWHLEEIVKPVQVSGLNEFNPTIARARAERLFVNLLKLVNFAAMASDIDTIYLGLAGDFITGWIHEEGQQTNAMTPIEAAMFAGDIIASGIDYILKNSKYKIIGDALPGNHGRMTKKMQHSNVIGTSLETVIYARIIERFRTNPRVNIQIAGGGMVYRKFFDKFVMRMIHGYELKYQGGIGGLTIPLKRMIAGWDKGLRADLTVLGHFHQYLPGRDYIANGSLIGFNSYAQAIAASPEAPQQAFFVIHERHGGCLATQAPIWVD